MPLSLLEVFPDEDYRFHLTLRAADTEAYFAPTNPQILSERGDWLRRDPARYVAATSDAEPLLQEFEAWAARWCGREASLGGSVRERLSFLGAALEPDFLLLSPDCNGQFLLRAGAVCFPSSWALEEKIGRTLDEIHGPVPRLNPTLAGSINRFLSRLKPGSAFERANWGLAATHELNLHPALNRPRLVEPLSVDHVWVRIEDQLLAALPSGRGVLFGIRLRLLPLAEVTSDSVLHARFLRALSTMSEAVVGYKGLTAVRAALVR